MAYLLKNNDFKLVLLNGVKDNKIEQKLYDKLRITKEKIDDNKDIWEKNKKHISNYEFIYTSSNNINNISAFYPISRSYFKIIEIIYDFEIINIIRNDNIVCLCEAPGGFIQCILEISKKYNCDINRINTITLLSESNYIPYWNSSIINNNLVNIHVGYDKTGNIFELKNVLHFIKNNPKSILITADGGFDYSVDYNNQEELSYPLIYSEIMIALSLQKKDGVFICKIFDIFNLGTFQLIYILLLSYRDIYLHKPKMSRISNSEKYIICKGFKGYNKNIMNILIHNFKKKTLNIQVPDEYILLIQKYNQDFVNNQIENIDRVFKNDKKNDFKKKIEKSQEWCKKYNIPINNNSKYLL